MGLVGIFVYGWNYLKRAKVIFKNILKDTFVLFSFLSLLGFELYSMIDTGTFVPLPTMMIVFIMFAVVERHHKEQALLPDALMKEELLPYGDCDFIRGVASYIGRNQLPSPAQCRRLLKIVEKAEDKGYIMP